MSWAGFKNLLLILLVLAVILTPGLLQTRDLRRYARTAELMPHRSTFWVSPSGMKALFVLLQRAGFHPERLRRPLTRLGKDPGLLVLAPSQLGQARTDDECRALRQWLKQGNTVLLLSGDPMPDETLEFFGVQEQKVAQEPTAAVPAEVVQPVSLLSAVTTLAVASRARLDLVNSSGGLLPLCQDREGTVLALATAEEGGLLYLCSDAGIFSNDRLDQADNAVLAVNLGEVAPGGRVIFDEFHQGYGGRPSLAAYLWQPPRRWASLQLLVALCLFLFSAATRFGRVVPEPPRIRRRDPAEYVRSIASLYQSAQAAPHALAIIYQHLLSDIALSLGLPRQASVEQVSDALSALRPKLAPEAREVLARAQAALASGQVSEQVLQARALELSRLRRKIIG